MATSSYTDTRLLINGEWCDAASGKTLDVVNPATGKPIGKVAHAGKADLDRALEAAQKGFEAWRKVPANERATTMRKAAGFVRERADSIARLMTQEQGKPFAEARVEVLSAADIIEWFADEGRRSSSRRLKRRPHRPHNCCRPSSTQACPPARSASCSAIPPRFRAT
jgi:succinate-semialdehyde dehydrogenase/glutarate-semialdehyde dehydrogenase